MIIPIKKIITEMHGYVGPEIKKYIKNEVTKDLKDKYTRRKAIVDEIAFRDRLHKVINSPEPKPKKNPITSRKIIPQDKNNPYNKMRMNAGSKINLKV